MNSNVIIKSFPNGISVKLSDKPDFSEILKETKISFEKTASFFKDASVVLRFEGRTLSDEEIDKLTSIIKNVSQLKILCVVCSEREDNIYFAEVLDKIEKEKPKTKEPIVEQSTNSRSFQFYKGNLKDGVSYETEGNVIILGDVLKGAAVFAKGNVIVLGTISGTVFAGKSGDTNRFIAALSFSPEHLKIGSIKYQKDKKEKFTLNKKQPKIAYVKNGKFTFSELDFTKELPDYNF